MSAADDLELEHARRTTVAAWFCFSIVAIAIGLILFGATADGMMRENDKVAWACQQQAAARGVSAAPCGLTSDQQWQVDRDKHNAAEAARIAQEAAKRLMAAP